MAKYTFGLMNILEGYVRNYRRLNIHQASTSAVFTTREISYFAQLGEYLGFFTFVEDSRPPKSGRSRPMDLSWWQSNDRIDPERFTKLVLHLERENSPDKGIDTIEKLFADSGEDYIPEYVIGIQNVEDDRKVKKLNDLVIKKNQKQKSKVLMIYRFPDENRHQAKVWAYEFGGTSDKCKAQRKMICFIDDSSFWTMCFEEEYPKNRKDLGLMK